MGFEDGAMSRLARYRREADEYMKILSGTNRVADAFCTKLFDGIEYTSELAERAGFGVAVGRGEGSLSLRISSGEERVKSGVTFVRIKGIAAETDEYLMHEEMSRHTLEPSGYSGRILGWVEGIESPVQTFAIYRDGTWRTKGMLVERSRGNVGDPQEILRGFCLRIVGRTIDLASPTSGSGRVWDTEGYSIGRAGAGEDIPVRTRWLK